MQYTFCRIALERDRRSSLFIRDDASWRTLAISFSSLLDLMDRLRARGKITAMRHRFPPSSERVPARNSRAAKLRFALKKLSLSVLLAYTRTWRDRRQWIKHLQSLAGRSRIVQSDTANLWKLRLLQLPACTPGYDTQVHPIISCSNIWKILHDADNKSRKYFNYRKLNN